MRLFISAVKDAEGIERNDRENGGYPRYEKPLISVHSKRMRCNKKQMHMEYIEEERRLAQHQEGPGVAA